MNFLLLNLFVALLFTAITTLLIGIFVLFKSRGNKTNQIFALYSFSIAGWALIQALANTATNYLTAVFLAKLMVAPVFFIPTLFLHFVISFLNLDFKNKQWFLRGIYLLSFIFAVLGIFTPYMVADAAPMFFMRYFLVRGSIYDFGLAFFFICVIYGLYKLFKELKTSKNEARRNQIKYLFWSSLVGYVGGAANFLYLYDIYVPILMPFGTYFVGFYVFVVAYAILKYQLMDIRVIIKKAFLYSLGITLASGLIIGISFLSNWFVVNIPGFRFWTIPLLAGIGAFIIGRLFWQKSKQVEKAYEVEKQARQELQHLSAVKDQFILATQHHLRTPLTITKGYLSVILRKYQQELPQSVKNYLNKADSSTNRLIKLVNELLDISQFQVGKQPLNLQPANIRNLIDEILKEIQPEIQSKDLSVKIIPENQQDWPLIQADAEKLRIALFNIINNAVKYTPSVKIPNPKFQISKTEQFSQIVIQGKKIDSFYQISIKDQGIGINPEEIPTLFTRYFERGEQAQKLYPTGRGIGLFITASIVKAHNGKIWAESQGLNKGATFYVELPITI